MSRVTVVLLLALVCSAYCKPFDDVDVSVAPTVDKEDQVRSAVSTGRIWKRFVNPALTYGGFQDASIVKMRTKRSEEECEKLELCKLHARSSQDFVSAFELYFVNKENAKFWDHHYRSIANCQRRFSACVE